MVGRWFQSFGICGRYEIKCTNPCVRHNPLSKWCVRLTLQTWRLVGISDRDDGCVSRMFFVQCFTAVGVNNYVTFAIIFLSSVRDCLSGVSRNIHPPHRTDFSFVEKLVSGLLIWHKRIQNDGVIFCLFLPIFACHVEPYHGCFENPANENDKCALSFLFSI